MVYIVMDGRPVRRGGSLGANEPPESQVDFFFFFFLVRERTQPESQVDEIFF